MPKYYKNNWFLRFLRFFNLLEPDVNILSISKIFMWVMLGVLLFALFYMPENLEVIITATGTMIATLLNYSYRRWIQYRREVTGKEFSDPSLSDNVQNINPYLPPERYNITQPDEVVLEDRPPNKVDSPD